jgi:hypothetical protein
VKRNESGCSDLKQQNNAIWGSLRVILGSKFGFSSSFLLKMFQYILERFEITEDQLTNYLEKLGYFSNPPKKSCSNFFWVAQDLILVQLILIMQKITKKSLFGHFLGYPPQNALQCTTVQCNGLKCKRLNYSLQMGQI